MGYQDWIDSWKNIKWDFKWTQDLPSGYILPIRPVLSRRIGQCNLESLVSASWVSFVEGQTNRRFRTLISYKLLLYLFEKYILLNTFFVLQMTDNLMVGHELWYASLTMNVDFYE